MKNTNKRAEKRNPYRTAGLERITAPMPEKSVVSGKSTVTSGDMRVRGKQ